MFVFEVLLFSWHVRGAKLCLETDYPRLIADVTKTVKK